MKDFFNYLKIILNNKKVLFIGDNDILINILNLNSSIKKQKNLLPIHKDIEVCYINQLHDKCINNIDF